MSISENTTALESILSSISTIITGDKQYVSFIKAQNLTEEQKAQARTNIGINYIVLQSPNGTQYTLSVDDNGMLTAIPIND